jgi:hypothetical protein
MPNFPVRERRHSKRILHKVRASLVINHLEQRQERLPCLVLDSSAAGFRLRGSLHLRRGQVVEVILDEDPLNSVRCSVAWIGKASSPYQGEAGLQTVERP